MPSAIINDENLAVHTAGVSPMKQKSRKYNNDFSNPNFFANSKKGTKATTPKMSYTKSKNKNFSKVTEE